MRPRTCTASNGDAECSSEPPPYRTVSYSYWMSVSQVSSSVLFDYSSWKIVFEMRKKRKAITPIISGARLEAQCSAVSIHIWRLLLLLISCNDVCSCISGRGGANTSESVTRVHNNCICVRLRRAYLVVGAAASTKATRDDSRPCLCLSALNSY